MRLSNYLSFSQYNSFNNGTYEKYYLLGEKLQTKYLDFGKEVAEKLEQELETFGLPIPDEREKKLFVNFQGIPLLGYLDGFSSKEEIIIDEYKTGVNHWTQKKVDAHEQLDFYAIMVSEELKVPIENIRIRLHWLETFIDTDGKIKLSGRLETFETKRTNLDVLKIYPKIKKAWIGIEKIVDNYIANN